MKHAETEYQPIENYGVIGDLSTIALVGINGSIDFMCFPQFDSPSVFGAMLDRKKGGFFRISPVDDKAKKKQLYLPETNILLTRFLLENGIGEVTDFMPIADSSKKNTLIRKVTSVKGEVTFRMHCCPRFNYARSSHNTKLLKNAILFTDREKNGLNLKLTSSVPLQVIHGDGFSEFTLKTGESAEYILENIQENESCSRIEISSYIENVFLQTHRYWKEWAASSNYNGRWREMVIRSALVLKLLISNQYGSIIAAPTFSLPEKIGGHKNWDYRFSWIRDAAFTTHSLMLVGYKEEAKAFAEWTQKICEKLHKKSGLSPLYGVDGIKPVDEFLLNDLEGYMKSPPVRVGNAADKQVQIDIYGEFIDSIYVYDKYVAPISYEMWVSLSRQIDWVIKNWKKKDCGIWETRGASKHFLHSKLMSWVALDRIIKLGNKHSFPIHSIWLKTRDEIFKTIYQDFWNKKRRAFVQYKNGSELDASLLLMPLMKFVTGTDPEWLSTLKQIEEDLVVDCLVYRYRPEEDVMFGLKEGEGTFSACSFWFVECLSRSGQLQKAELYFDKMLSYSNHLGLYSEQLGLQAEHLGNFPQAFTHLALISAAYDLNKRLNKKKIKL